MFFRYLEFIFVPFRTIYNKWLQIMNVKGNIHMDVGRMKALGQRGKMYAAEAQQGVQNLQNKAGLGGQAQAQSGAAQGAQYSQQPQQAQGANGSYGQAVQPHLGGQGSMQHSGSPAGAMPGHGAPNAAPPIRSTGMWFWKKSFCSQCNTQLDKSWDRCPFCAQMAAQATAAAADGPKQPLKTQAFMMDATGRPGQMQMLAWLVPLVGTNKGELFTLSPTTIIGNDPASTIILSDRFMSGRHAEIKVENGSWVLKDLGSTNGTYVNNRRVDRHELVDNDFIKFGGLMVKFKSLG